MSKERDRHFLLVLALVATLLVGWLLFSFAGAFFAAAVMAGALQPMQERTTRRLKGRPHLAAAVLTVAVMLSVVVPLAVLSAFLVNEGNKAARWVNQTVQAKGLDGVVEPLPDPLEAPAKRLLRMLPASFLGNAVPTAVATVEPQDPGVRNDDARGAGPAATGAPPADDTAGLTSAAGAALGALKRLGSVLAQGGIFVLALFFFLAEGPRLVKYMVEIAPLEKSRSRALLASFREVSIGVLISAVVTAAAQTIVAVIGYVIASVPVLPLVIFATFICAFIPAIGGASVTVLAGILMWMSGHPGMGIFLVVWGIAAVGTVDNVVKPLVAKGRAQMPASLVFFAMICGVAAFGPLGLIAGPLIVAFFQSVLRMLREHPKERAASRHSPVSRSTP